MRKIVAVCVLPFVLGVPLFGLTACKDVGQSCRYEIRAEYYRDEGKLEGRMNVLIPNNTENALEEIPFSLYANCFREGAKTPSVSDLYEPAVFYDGASYGGIQIEEVTGGEAWSVGGEDENLLLVRLSEPLYPDESISLSVRYTLTLPKANHRLGIGENCVNLSCFYPQVPAQNESGFYGYEPSSHGDPFVFGCSDFSVSLTVPEDWTAACGGTVNERAENGKKVYVCTATNVRDMAFVLGNFMLSSEERKGVRIDYFHFEDNAPEQTLKAAADAIETYSNLLIDYPYERYALAETDLAMGGMEYGGFAMISSALRSEERAAVVAHETAHQWWFSLVGSDQNGCAWQDEGLAEYSVALFFEQNASYGKNYRDTVATCERAYRNYFSVESQLSEETNTAMSRPLIAFSGDYEYRVLSYDKGVVLFDRLRETMGDGKFFSSLRNYAKSFSWKVASEYDLISCFRSQEALILSFTEGKCVI